MPWIPYEIKSCPDEYGDYFVIKSYPGKINMGFFKPIPPEKKIELMTYKQKLRLEQDYHDRCVYVKYNAWVNKNDIEQNPDDILFWFKLDPIPEDKE